MAAILLANALLGFILSNIDNLGHAAGAIVGGLVGLLDRRMLLWRKSRTTRVAGVVGLTILVGSAAVQMQHRQVEQATSDRIAYWGRMVEVLWRLDQEYRALAVRGLNPVFVVVPKQPNIARRPPLIIPGDPAEVENRRLALRASLRQLVGNTSGFDQGSTSESYRTVRQLAARALFKPPTRDEFLLFEQALATLTRPAIDNWTQAQLNLNRQTRPDPLFGKRLLNRLARRGVPRPVDDAGAPPSLSARPRTPASNESAPETP